jgi:hypothetical protein
MTCFSTPRPASAVRSKYRRISPRSFIGNFALAINFSHRWRAARISVFAEADCVSVRVISLVIHATNPVPKNVAKEQKIYSLRFVPDMSP